MAVTSASVDRVQGKPRLHWNVSLEHHCSTQPVPGPSSLAPRTREALPRLLLPVRRLPVVLELGFFVDLPFLFTWTGLASYACLTLACDLDTLGHPAIKIVPKFQCGLPGHLNGALNSRLSVGTVYRNMVLQAICQVPCIVNKHHHSSGKKVKMIN